MKKINFDWPILGHQNIVSFLKKAILNKKVAQAYLFWGPGDIGKTTLVKYFAQSLLCKNFKEKIEIKVIPCDLCQPCQMFKKRIHPDVIWLFPKEDKKNISVEQIREIKPKIFYSSFLDSYKIVIIKEAHRLSQGGANALLKILEEPAKKTIFILLAEDISFLPTTIVSRCQVIKFFPVSQDIIFHYLVEKIGIKREEADFYSRLSFGRPGLAINFSTSKESIEGYKENIKNLIKIFEGNPGERLEIAESLVKNYQDFNELIKNLKIILDHWLIFVRDIAFYQNLSRDLIVNIFWEEKIKKIAESYSKEEIKKIILALEKIKKDFSLNINPRLLLENFLINYF